MTKTRGEKETEAVTFGYKPKPLVIFEDDGKFFAIQHNGKVYGRAREIIVEDPEATRKLPEFLIT